MQREVILFCSAAVSVSLSACKTGPEQNEPVSRPNILWITCEDMSARLGCYGDPIAITPNIDKLAEQGIRFTHAYSVSGVCAPSRAALITGMYPTSFGAQHMRTTSRTASLDQITDPELLAIPVYEAVPPPEARTYAELFRQAGYYTTNNVKTDYQFHNPVTAWDESSNQAHWRNRQDKDQPFFSVFNIMETHESRVWGNASKPLLVEPEEIELPPYYPDSPAIRNDMAIHYSNIMRMDSIVGTIIQQLEEDGLSGNTIVFFYSDHGDGLPRMKRWTYDSGLHVPLIVKFPDHRDSGTIDERLVSFVDFPATALSLAGLDVPGFMHGRPFLGEKKSAPREYIFASRDRMDPALDCIRTVRDKQYKYSRNYMPNRPYVQFLPYRDQMPLMQELFRFKDGEMLDSVQQLWFRQTKPEEELFDLLADPHEIHNLAHDPSHREIKDRLSRALDGWIEETNDPLTLPEPELVKLLWPPDGVQPVTEDVTFSISDGSLNLISPTEGASVAYQLNDAIGGNHWMLYRAPLQTGTIDSLTATAIRIGYKQSSISRYDSTP
ncbi:MAG: sulfatase [Bacteroidales bacterium]